MIDDLIEYYQRELTFLRSNAGAFAEAHPKIASRLRLTRDAIEDPHIGRLIEAVAFMNARLRHKIDDEFPELSDAMLMTLYPHLIQPVPSFMVARLIAEDGLDKPVTVPAGTMVSAEPVDGQRCRYRLCHDTQLLPIRVHAAAMGGPPLDAPALGLHAAKGVLRLTLATTKPEVDLAGLGIDTLRLFIKSDARRAQILIEQFGSNLVGIGVGTSPQDPRAVLLPPDALRLRGFGDDELLLPQTQVARGAYAVLQEFFAYPQKHLFVEVSGLAARTLDIAGDRLELFFYFDKLSSELERVVRADDFDLFACPAINLFEMDAEPIQLDHSSIEYRIVPDARREDAIEVHSVVDMVLQDQSGERFSAPPLHSVDRGSPRLGRMFHALARRSSFGPGGGDDVFVAVADLEGRLLRDDATVLHPRILATNRDLPARLPFGGGRPELEIDGTIAGLAGVEALTKPTPTRRPARRRAAIWKLVGQLSLNHLSLVGGSAGALALREVLALYDIGDTPETVHLRERLVGVTAAPGVARMRLKGHTAMCAGVDVTIEVEDDRLSGSGSFLLCSIIERFLASACALNSFVRVSAKLRREAALWKTWPTRVGDRPLI
ncbi:MULTISPECIES: type VI secretion system baseplate subunit TssF [unclassified Sphingomonas]|jgi:type VI secretion system protein ImpG|uniref:type VI secretion system baseplate subunit TssF n=1 Tax=unclassified Sphingomonas TaxID=196159 RepID=UPI000833881E|nr:MULTISPECIES: type VI secretion system baseplate subunit TssF [unclassified Sphingomonas]